LPPDLDAADIKNLQLLIKLKHKVKIITKKLIIVIFVYQWNFDEKREDIPFLTDEDEE